jgi:hypothetical protein
MARSASLPVGVILRRSPGVTRWASHSWSVAGIIPGDTRPGGWAELRRDGEVVDFHAGTVALTLWRSDVEAYMVALNGDVPSVWVIFRQGTGPEGMELQAVTASAYEAQDHMDNGEDFVERVAMPEGLAAWVAEFCNAQPAPPDFIKRKRGPKTEQGGPDGLGDVRIRQAADIYRAPGTVRRGRE